MIDRLLDASIVGGFTKTGFAVRARHFDPLPSMRGRTVVITGATSGIGLAAATQVTALGARTVVVGRSPDKLAAALARLGGGARGFVADLSSLDEVRRLAGEVGELEGTIDVLVNNVSVLSPRYAVSDDGVELTVATNLVGPFLLTNLLVPRIAAGGGGRVVTVSSGGMYTQRLDVDGLEMGAAGYRGSVAYARTKRAQVVLTELWADRLRDVGIVAHSMHPGWVDTPGLEGSLPGFRSVMRPLLRDPGQGADTIAFLAASAAAVGTSGLFWHDRRPRSTHRLASTREGDGQREALWEYLVERSGWVRPRQWPHREV